jgi:hypothetical protein
VVYTAAALGVVYNKEHHQQRFFRQHKVRQLVLLRCWCWWGCWSELVCWSVLVCLCVSWGSWGSWRVVLMIIVLVGGGYGDGAVVR